MLFLEGEILVDVNAKPRNISIGKLGKGEKTTSEFELQVSEPDKVKITNVTVDDDRFTVKKKSDDGKGGSAWEVEFKGSDKIDRLLAKIKVEYSGSDATEILIPIRAQIVGDLEYTRSLYFNKRKDEYPEREIVLSSRSGKQIVLKSIEDPDGLLKLDVGEKKGAKIVVKATVADPAQKHSKPERHNIKLVTNDPDEPEVNISYSITSRQPNQRGKKNLSLSRVQDRAVNPMRTQQKNAPKSAEEKPPKKTEEEK